MRRQERLVSLRRTPGKQEKSDCDSGPAMTTAAIRGRRAHRPSLETSTWEQARPNRNKSRTDTPRRLTTRCCTLSTICSALASVLRGIRLGKALGQCAVDLASTTTGSPANVELRQPGRSVAHVLRRRSVCASTNLVLGTASRRLIYLPDIRNWDRSDASIGRRSERTGRCSRCQLRDRRTHRPRSSRLKGIFWSATPPAQLAAAAGDGQSSHQQALLGTAGLSCWQAFCTAWWDCGPSPVIRYPGTAITDRPAPPTG